MMRDIIASPTANAGPLDSREDDNMADEENLIKVKLFFYCDEKALHSNVFTDEWYTVAAGEFGEDMVTRDFQPWIEVSYLLS